MELIEESRISCGENGVRINGSRDIADHLLANGVTINEWIPVTERLPGGECLAVSMLKYQPSYKEMLVGYVAKDARYETGYCCESDAEILPNVTHWTEKHYPAEGGE